MARILVVEDESDLRDLLSYNLRNEGHEVVEAATVGAAFASIRKDKPELVVLDLMLPDMSGTELCRMVKSDPATADIKIIMLTAKSEEADRIVGFELGADDYITKPFSLREFLLRVSAVLRRGQELSHGGERLVAGALSLDRSRHRVSWKDEDIALTALEFKLLYTLMSRRGRVQSRERLLEDVWEMNPNLGTRTVDTHIKRLREKLGPAGAYVETVRGVGYRFVEDPVEG